MSSIVYFADLQAKSNKDSILVKTAQLLEKLYKDKPFFKQKDLVGIKTHFGEIGLATFLRPIFSRSIVEKLKELGAIPFLFDTSTLYTNGLRTNAVGHITTAIKNGFSYATTGAAIIIADGIKGANHTEVEVDGKHFKKVKLASDIKHMDAIVCLSHFKGHCGTSFAGTLKTLSMGMACRAGKLEMHSDTKPFITNKCTGCGICITLCPVGAIGITPSPPLPPEERGKVRGKASIDPEICIGCMRCDTHCPVNAIKFNWDSPSDILMEKMTEYILGTLKLKKDNIAYLNFLLDITPDCDCYGFSNAPIAPNIGALASFDPLAIDQAAIDLVNKSADSDIFKKTWPNINYEHILKYSEESGIGKREYKLIQI